MKVVKNFGLEFLLAAARRIIPSEAFPQGWCQEFHTAEELPKADSSPRCCGDLKGHRFWAAEHVQQVA
jgi:hypothetical protein